LADIIGGPAHPFAMAKLEDLRPSAALKGILADSLVTVVNVQWYGSTALELTYKAATGKVAPLPHQITAVYDSMLARQPLRFLLADDPGAGKTIMAGLLMKEFDRPRRSAEMSGRLPRQLG
jgi:SpoVK/Ycf46/Vps4 family AAA+-type ATPase